METETETFIRKMVDKPAYCWSVSSREMNKAVHALNGNTSVRRKELAISYEDIYKDIEDTAFAFGCIKLNDDFVHYHSAFGKIVNAQQNLSYPDIPFAVSFTYIPIWDKILDKFPFMATYNEDQCRARALAFLQGLIDNGWFDLRTSRFEKGIENVVSIYLSTGVVVAPNIACGKDNTLQFIIKNVCSENDMRKVVLRYFLPLCYGLHNSVLRNHRFRTVVAAICNHFCSVGSAQGQMFGSWGRSVRQSMMDDMSEEELNGYWSKLFDSFKGYMASMVPEGSWDMLKILSGLITGALLIYIVKNIFCAASSVVNILASIVFKKGVHIPEPLEAQGEEFGETKPAVSAMVSVLCILGYGMASDFSKPNAYGNLFRNVGATSSVMTNIANNLEDAIRYLLAGLSGDETWKKSAFSDDIQNHLDEIEELKAMPNLESRLRNCNIVRNKVLRLYDWQLLHKISLGNVCFMYKQSAPVLMLNMRLVTTWRETVIQSTTQEGLRVQPLCVMLSGVTGQGKTLVIELIAHALHSVARKLGRVQDDQKVTFSKAKITGYWDGYAKNFAYVDDEWLCSGDATRRDEELVSFLQIISTGTAPLNYAKLECKGISDFDSQVAIFATNFVRWDTLQNTSPSAIFKRINYPLDVKREGDALKGYSQAWSFTLSDHAREFPHLYVDVCDNLFRAVGCRWENNRWCTGEVKRISMEQLMRIMRDDFITRTVKDKIVTPDRVAQWMDDIETESDSDVVSSYSDDGKSADSAAEGEMWSWFSKPDFKTSVDRSVPGQHPLEQLEVGSDTYVSRRWLNGSPLDLKKPKGIHCYLHRLYSFIAFLKMHMDYDSVNFNLDLDSLLRSQDPTYFATVCPRQWREFNSDTDITNVDIEAFMSWHKRCPDDYIRMSHCVNYGGAFTGSYNLDHTPLCTWLCEFRGSDRNYTPCISYDYKVPTWQSCSDYGFYGLDRMFEEFWKQLAIRKTRLGIWFNGCLDGLKAWSTTTSFAIFISVMSAGLATLAGVAIRLIYSAIKKWYYCIAEEEPEVCLTDYDPIEGQGSDIRREQHVVRQQRLQRQTLVRREMNVSAAAGQTGGQVQRFNACQMKALKLLRGVQIFFENGTVRFGKCLAIGKYLVMHSHMFWRDGEVAKIRLLASVEDYLNIDQRGFFDIRRSQMTFRDCMKDEDQPTRDMCIIHVNHGPLGQKPAKVVVDREEWHVRLKTGVVRVYPKGPYHPATVAIPSSGCYPMNREFGTWVQDEDGQKITRHHSGGWLARNIEGVVGDCSDPYLSGDGALLGLHVSSVSGNSIFMPVYLDDFPDEVGTQAMSYVPESESFGQGVAMGARYIGTLKTNLTGKAKNAYVPTIYAGEPIDADSPYVDPVFPMKRVPAPLDGLDGVSPWSKQDTNYGRTSSGDYPEDFLKIVDDNPLYLLEGFIPFDVPQARRLTEHEAINGVPGELRSLDLSTSAGLVGKVNKLKRSQMFEGEIGEKVAVGPLRAALDEIQDMVDEHTVPMVSCMEMHKTELLPPDKLPRTFSACSPDHVIWTKQVCGDALRIMKDYLPQCASAVGVNPHGCEWQMLEETVVHAFGDDTKIGKGDISNCDLSVACIFAYLMFHMFQIFYRYVPGSRDWWELYLCCMSVMSQVRVRGSRLFELDRGHPSGHYLTGILNIVCIYVIHRYAYIKEVDLFKYPMKDNLVLKLYGDDSLDAIHRRILHCFNMKVIQEYFAKFGMIYTDSDKNTEITPYFEPSEADFLSRTFRRKGGITYAPLNIDAIYGMVMFVRTENGVSVEEALDLNVRAALMEAAQHGKEFFIDFKNTLWLEGRKRGYVAPSLLRFTYQSFEDWKFDSYNGSTQPSSLGLSVDQMTDWFWD